MWGQMGALKPIFDWDTQTSYDQLSGVVQAPTLKPYSDLDRKR